MRFEISRQLKNKVFKTAILRMPVYEDPNEKEEKRLEDDFGSVKVQTGGQFAAYVAKSADSGKLTFTPILSSTDKETIAKANFKFALPDAEVILSENVSIEYSCNSNLEVAKAFDDIKLGVLEIAEEKCKIFETVMQDRITLAVDEWKAQFTNFENESVPGFDVPLSPLG